MLKCFAALLTLLITSTSFAQDQSFAGLNSPLSTLALPHDGTPMHEGSWDRSGGNADARGVDPGQTLTLFDHTGAGIVRRFWVTIAPRSEMHIHRQAILRMYWDGDTNPAVECPIGDFFGVGFGEQKDYTSLPLNEMSGGYNCYWPMPFHKSVKWTLTNLSDHRIDAFYYNIDYTSYDKIPDQLRHFHAQWNRENPTTPGKNYTILHTTGEGHFVGVALFMQARKPHDIGFLEGDEMVYVDGSDKPCINGTGTEDYFCSGWYFDHGPYSAPFHGCVIKDEKLARVSAYRWQIEDALPYHKSIDVTIEHGTNNDHEADYSSVAYFYQAGPALPPPLLPKDPKDLLPYIPPAPKKITGAIEGEDLVPTAKATAGDISVQQMDSFGDQYSGSAQLWWRPQKSGETLTLQLPVQKDGTYEVLAHFVKAPDYANISVQLNNGTAKDVNLFNPTVAPTGPISLGQAALHAGNNTLTIKTTVKDPNSKGYLVGLDALELKPAQ